MSSKLLVVNADDFGFTRDVNAGIVQAHKHGILTATTLMANGDAFDDAVKLAKDVPTLDVGCHLVLIQGRSLVSGDPLPESWKDLLAKLSLRRLDPYRELAAQVEKILAAGLRPTHLDTHKHTHVLPNILSVVVRLANEFNVPFIRLPFDTGWMPVRAINGIYRRRLARKNVQMTDHFLGFRLTDHLTEQTLSMALAQLPEGSTEFMCHPGYLGKELARAATRLKQTREKELRALTSQKVRKVIRQQQIVLTNYRELAQA